ncbi:MAG: arginase family protein [Candidatus Promineifilaceae bacterium]
MTIKHILTPYFLDEVEEDMFDLAKPGWEVIQPFLPPGTKKERMATLYRSLRDAVAAAAAAGDKPVSVAGDCCTTIGVLAGLQQAGVAPSLIWFDAHGDFNTWETSPSGFLGGMPLAMLVGLGEQTIVEGIGMKILPEERVILTDARDLDPGEKEAVAGSGVKHLTDVADLLESPLPEGPIWVHFDVDILNTRELPAVSYPAPGGPSADLLRRVFKRLASTGRLVAVSLSSWNDELDQDGRSRDLSMELLSVLVD